MVVKGRNHNTAFILGAGATRGAIRHVLVNGKRIKPPLNSDFFHVAAKYATALGGDSPTAQRLHRLKRLFRRELPLGSMDNMEEAFSLLYVAKDFPAIYRTGPGPRPRRGYRQEIEDFLRVAFAIFTELDRGSSDATGYDGLVAKLGQTDTLITLNYDTLLDSALVRAGWSPTKGYSLGGSPHKVKWHPARRDVNPHLAGVRLLKLHGSVNWFVKGSFSQLRRVFENKPVVVTRPRKNGVRAHIRQIVPPIYGKFFDHEHWERLWHNAFQALSEAEVLVVIGCSLIETDFHLRALVNRVATSRKQGGVPFRRAVFVDRNGVRRKWKQALKGRFTSLSEHTTFENFLRRELRV